MQLLTLQKSCAYYSLRYLGRKLRADPGEVQWNQTREGLAGNGEALELFLLMKNLRGSEAIDKTMFLKDHC